MNRQELILKFKSIYENLNEEQKNAVDHIYGPMLVIAGPGTGKTQILSARIGKILLETDFLAENILCLTYTDAGRTAMRKRLQEMIGADAYAVNIHTFHSFCNQVIQENVSLFEKNSLEAVSELERIDFIKTIINDLSKDNPLKRYRGDVYFEIGRLGALFSEMKKEGWTSEFIKEHVNQYIQSLPEKDGFTYKVKRTTNGVTYQKGDLNVKKIQEETKKVEIILYAADAFDVFQNIMNQHARYDFDDMINWVIKAFDQHEGLRLDQQEKYQVILVDEFQDTSGTQNRLIDCLCQDIESPNIFVVGDDDQSIYRFQGANIQNIEDYKQKYKGDLKDVVLKSNYRSTQSILDMAKYVIGHNQNRLSHKYPEIVKDLLASHPKRTSSIVLPRLQVYENSFQEMVGITMRVQNLIQQGTAPQDIAILYKENKWGEELLKFFKEKNIPFYAKRKENLFELSLSKKMLTILRYIAAEQKIPYSADDLLFEILHFDLYHIPAFEVAKASIKAHTYKSSLRNYIQEVIHVSPSIIADEKLHEGIIHVSNLLEKWIGESFNTTIIQLVENIMLEGKFLETALNDKTNKLWNLEVLRCLMDFVKEEMHRHPHYQLSNLMDIIDLMEEQKIRIPLYRVYGNENGVNLLTTHGSKGLEFHHVFLMNTVGSVWEKKASNRRGFKLPDNMYRSLHDAGTEDRLEELRRLFYVAITRAEENLYISWGKKDDQEKVLEPSQFIAEITDHMNLNIEQMKVDEEDILDFLPIYLHKNKMPVNEQGEQELIATLLDQFEMNATALNNYLNCPFRFYYQNLIRVPTGRSENSEFGSAVHFALEKYFTKAKENEYLFPTIEVFLKDFEWYMYKHRESFTQEAYKRRLEYGQTILQAYYENNIDTWKTQKGYSIESSFSHIVLDGVPLKGKIDKILYNDTTVIIIDYKTGDPSKALKKLKGPSDKDAVGGDYWRQGVFYKLMVEAYKLKEYQVVKTEFQFVEPDADKKYMPSNKTSIIPSLQEMDIVRMQIKETWHKIQAHDFYTGCGKETCQWCNFVKDHRLYKELKDANLEDILDEDE